MQRSTSELKVAGSDRDVDLLGKTEQLVYFRLTFAVACLGVVLLFGVLVREKFDLALVLPVCAAWLAYLVCGLFLLRLRLQADRRRLSLLNCVLLTFDIAAVSAVLHLTGGVDSDLYFLYLLPILLSSYSFGRQGIFLTAAAAAAAYIGVLAFENSKLLPYMLGQAGEESPARAYVHRLFTRMASRSAIFVAVAFIWGAFCHHMSRLARYGEDRLLDELKSNTSLVAETRAQAAREHLINAISSQVRSTLDLDRILETTAAQLQAAVGASRCAIVCPPAAPDGEPLIWEAVSEELPLDNRSISAAFCRFVLDERSSYKQAADGSLIKTYVLPKAEAIEELVSVRDEILRLSIESLVLQPIMYGLASMGVLMIAECGRPRSWAEVELDLLRSVAGQVAIALEHARLVDQLSRKNKDLIRKNINLDQKNLELRTMQAQLIHQEKMASLGRIVAGIAHELNNPVNFVHGNLPYLAQHIDDLKRIITAAGQSGDRQELDRFKEELKYDFVIGDLEHIIADLDEGCERIRHIVRNLKSFSRLDEAELKEASIQEGIEATVKILNQYYGRDRIPVEMRFTALPPLLCYPGQLNQVWMNLLANAAEALEGPAHGQGAKVTISGRLEGGSVLVSITDNGAGIVRENRSKIFEPFFTTKPVGKGTGLGLSICHSIVQAHGGAIWFESTPGCGTTFNVRLPLALPPVSEKSRG